MPTQLEKAERFRAMHVRGRAFVLPNAWDVASAKVLAEAGFPALGTTSAGIAFALGYPDGERVGRGEMLDVVCRIAGAVDIPVTADLEAGYGPTPEDVGATVRRAVGAGAVGVNLEDGTGDPKQPLMPIEEAAARIRAARAAADATGIPAVINARTDGFWSGGSGEAVLADAIRRANAYRQAGADCLFVPFVHDREAIARLAREIDGPINILAGPKTMPAAELAQLGVARISIGGSLYRACLALARRAASEMRDKGTFGFTADAVPHPEVNRLLSE